MSRFRTRNTRRKPIKTGIASRSPADRITPKNAPSEQQNQLINYFRHHHHCFCQSLTELRQTALTQILTLLTIGIALALPSGLYILLQHATQVTQVWDHSPHISVFLGLKTNEEQAYRLAELLQHRPEISHAAVITREQAAAEFDLLSGFGDLLADLPQNPLPHTVTLTPQENIRPFELEQLKLYLEGLPEVDLVQFDLNWLQRLLAYLNLGQRLAWISSVLMGLSVIVIVGNTIRLMLQNHRTEIEIIKLVGATNSFTQRPFLYSGFWLGLLGSLIACILVVIGLCILSTPVAELAKLYHSNFHLQVFNIEHLSKIVALGIGLSVLGSWLVVHHFLKQTPPMTAR